MLRQIRHRLWAGILILLLGTSGARALVELFLGRTFADIASDWRSYAAPFMVILPLCAAAAGIYWLWAHIAERRPHPEGTPEQAARREFFGR